MKKLFTTVLVLVTVLLTGCASAPKPERVMKEEQPIVVYREVPVIQQVPVYVPMYQPYYQPSNVFVPVPGQPPRTTRGQQPQYPYYYR